MLTDKKNVTYTVVPRKNPQKQDEAPKYYMQAHATEFIGITGISKRIEKECTVTRADVMAVLTALEDVFVDVLNEGKVIRLGDLGSFYLSISSRGAEDEESVNGSLVKRTKINFRPGQLIQKCLKGLTFSKYVAPGKENDPDENPDENPENNGD